MTFAFWLTTGWTYFLGVILIAVSLGLPLARRRPLAVAQRCAALVGVVGVVLAATPASPVTYMLGSIAFLGAFVTSFTQKQGRFVKLRLVFRGAIILIALNAAAHELVWQRTDHVRGPVTPRLFVLGDSLSAGVGDATPAWPTQFAAAHHFEVTNLAAAGATAATARRQADRLPPEPGVVVILVGGNDLLSGVGAADFAANLRYLLERAREYQRPVVMFELPLLPLCNGYGYAQRHLAREFGVTLIPRYRLALLLADPANTSDRLHLSERGSAALAELVWSVVGRDGDPRNP